MSNVTKFYPANSSKNPDSVLEQAMGEYSDVIILGYNKDGMPDFRATDKFADGGEVLWLIEAFKFSLLSGDFSE